MSGKEGDNEREREGSARSFPLSFPPLQMIGKEAAEERNKR